MFGLKQDIGIDLGTANVLVYVRGQGVVLREPSVVAIDREQKRILAVGEEAREMLGRTPGNIVAIRPLREGVIADFDTTESMIRYFVNKVKRRGLLAGLYRKRLMVCVPAGVTSVEKRAVLEAAEKAGADKVYLIEEPVAAALGAGLKIDQSVGSMVIDIGGGTTDIAVLSLGGVVQS
ncbi:MAG: rod shape-determining protein, partial [Negativicutes bacterium]|nr:rod shape-determining protein [Negativicutes bacterium]